MMAREMHDCPVAGCGRRCSSAYLMCRSDWWRVSPPTRSLVYDTFSGGAGLFTPEYREAREAAIKEADDSRARALRKAIDNA